MPPIRQSDEVTPMLGGYANAMTCVDVWSSVWGAVHVETSLTAFIVQCHGVWHIPYIQSSYSMMCVRATKKVFKKDDADSYHRYNTSLLR